MLEDSKLPSTPLLDSIDSPMDLRLLQIEQLPRLAEELRRFLMHTIGQVGGHFGAGLGVVELTIALHYVFETPEDVLIWDVGHQSYPHKILTGRRAQLATIRQQGGLAPFPYRNESAYDPFGTGHSSTSISAALGMAQAARHCKGDYHSVAVIGDGAMTAGMAFEALNHAGDIKADLLVILNDNAMSISHNVGALSKLFTRVIAGNTFLSMKELVKEKLESVPGLLTMMHHTEGELKHIFLPPSAFFESLGFNYTGILDGHDIAGLIKVLRGLKDSSGPQLLHIKTQKGKGFMPAERDPIGYHALAKVSSKSEQTGEKKMKYTDVFSRWICDIAEKDDRIVAITPAMREGSGLVEFSQKFPARYYDVGIAEQHAISLAAGMACRGLRPIVAIYSTFLQRGYDQLIHDVCLQNLPVVFALDRAGLVGGDGATHNGNYDLSYLSCIPELVVMTPSDENETYRMLSTALSLDRPVAVRYPRGEAVGVSFIASDQLFELGKGSVVLEGSEIALLVFGALLDEARQVADKYGWTLADMRFVKPLDTKLVEKLAKRHKCLVTLEENVIIGGAGSQVLQHINQRGLNCELLQLGIADQFVHHASQQGMRSSCGLDVRGIEASIKKRWKSLGSA